MQRQLSLQWGVKASFREYVKRANGVIEVRGRATCADDEFSFPTAVGTPVGGREIRFDGEVHFNAHDGMLSVTLMDPWIIFDSAGMSLTVVDPDYLPDRSKRIRIARLATPSRPTDAADRIDAALTLEGARLLGDVYPVGTRLDPVALPVRNPCYICTSCNILW